ncbi:HAD family hydrolase [Halomicrococcus sp. NG-SE-24]|uniref:HAD family hydrolase n=1 Tax=Halomicrococcus sp. NG-SE-24 TaxID=3436928 RepID=UPI003D986EBA
MAVSFDLFGTLVEVTPPDDPARAVATELAARDVPVPSDWERAYAERHVETESGAELSLVDHVVAGLDSRGVAASEAEVRATLLDAFATPVRTKRGARAAVGAAAERGPVGVLSNCSVPGLVPRVLSRSELRADAFDAVVSSVGCGWRKPDERAFECVAERLNVSPSELRHVGDDPDMDGGATAAGATSVLLEDVPLTAVPSHLESAE